MRKEFCQQSSYILQREHKEFAVYIFDFQEHMFNGFSLILFADFALLR